MTSLHERVTLQYVHVPGVDRWQPKDSQWLDNASDWLVAHDLYHHCAEDTGTWEQEVETLGAEYYVNDEYGDNHDDVRGALSRSAGSIVGLSFESNGDPSSLMLVEGFPIIADEVRTRLFFNIACSASLELRCILVNDSPEAEALLKQADGGWPAFQSALHRGYLKAQSRYPDRQRVRRAWHALLEQLKLFNPESLPFGAVITLARQGYDFSVAVG